MPILALLLASASADSAAPAPEPRLEGPAVWSSRERQAPWDLQLDSIRLQDLSAGAGALDWEKVVQELPGAISDEDGRMHVRGQNGDGQVLIDGIPLLGSRQRVLSPLPDPRLLSEVDLRTTASAADLPDGSPVFAGRTRSVAGREGFAGISWEATSAASQAFSALAGGSPVSGFGILFGASSAQSDRYLDPALSMDAYHTAGQNLNYLGKLEARGDAWNSELLGWGTSAGYDIPRRMRTSKPEDQRSVLGDLGAGWVFDAAPWSSLGLHGTAYAQTSDSKVRSGSLSDLSDSADLADAIAQNDRMFVGGERHREAYGASANLSWAHSVGEASGMFRFGADGEMDRLRERIALGVIDSSLIDSALGGDPRLAPYFLPTTGTPFRVAASGEIYSSALWATEEIRSGAWRSEAGLRLQRIDAGNPDWFVCPSVRLTWASSGNLLVWAGYDRTVTRPPMEYLLISSTPQAVALAGSAQTGIDAAVQPERADQIEIGSRWRSSTGWMVRAAGWGRWSHDGLVSAELGNSGMLFPLNLKDVVAGGFELSGTYDQGGDWSGHLTGSVQGAAGLVPDDGSSPVTAGLIFGEEGANYRHPWKGEDVFPLEHNQLWKLHFDVKLKLPARTWASVGVRADAGLPFDLSNADGSSLDENGAKDALRKKGYSESTIELLDLSQEEPGSPDRSTAARVLFDLSAGWNGWEGVRGILRLEAGIRNLLDSDYLTRFETSMGGMHWGEPRTFWVAASWSI